MILELVTFALGMAIGMNIRSQKLIDQYDKNFDEIDREVRKELELNRNLVDSYKQDIERLKQQMKDRK